MKWKDYIAPTKLKVSLTIIFFVLTPISSGFILPIPLVYLIGGLDQPRLLLQDIFLILSWGLIPQLILGLFFSFFLAHLISKKYYFNQKTTTKPKTILLLIGRSILYLIVYLFIMSITTALFRLR